VIKRMSSLAVDFTVCVEYFGLCVLRAVETAMLMIIIIIIQELGRRAIYSTGVETSERPPTCSSNYQWLCKRGMRLLFIACYTPV